MTESDFIRLPRHPGYHYEFDNGQASLVPQPRHYHAFLNLTRMPTCSSFPVRRAATSDVIRLAPVFAEAFHDTQPYAGLDQSSRLLAARQALARTISGGDGPWIEQASFVALEGEEPIGGIWSTLVFPGDIDNADPCRALDIIHGGGASHDPGRPHMTWVFVSPRVMNRGIGTTLLSWLSNALLDLGYQQLLTTFMTGNEASMLWHWRNGFSLLPRHGAARANVMNQRSFALARPLLPHLTH
jgi:GNAT superfamily N-acetyltransferase